jgi:hypothetical protein
MTSYSKWLVALAFALLAVAAGVSSVAAQDRHPQLPNDCWSGEIVVSEGSGEFDCVPIGDLLRISGCSDGDFVTADGSGRLECTRPSSSSWGVRALLPECSSGDTLVSEGFGRWKCQSAGD